jgi:hypothetical protein
MKVTRTSVGTPRFPQISRITIAGSGAGSSKLPIYFQNKLLQSANQFQKINYYRNPPPPKTTKVISRSKKISN